MVSRKPKSGGSEEAVAQTPLPHNLDAERSVIGAIILDNRNVEGSSLRAEDFFDHSNQSIYAAILAMDEERQAIDLITLCEKLNVNGELASVGGAAYISSLIDGIPAVSNVQHYARIVRDKATLRAVVRKSEATMLAALVANGSPDSLIDSAIESMLELAAEAATGLSEGINYRDAGVSLLTTLGNKSVARVYTGIKALDDFTGGFLPCELVTVTANTGVGKTLLAQQLRRRACADGLHTLYCSAEMTPEHLVSRELATEAGVPHWKMRHPERVDREDMASLVEAVTHECEKCRILSGELSLRRIRLAARRLKKQQPLDAVIMDYDELIEAPGKDELQRQANLVRGAKYLGLELKIPVVMISQIRKASAGERKGPQRPTLENIYGAGAKSKHSSIVLHIHRPWVKDLEGSETDAQIYILKGRDSGPGKIDVLFNVQSLRFEDAPNA